MTCCPHCGEALTVTITAPQVRAEPDVREIELIEPCLIADRLQLSEAYVRKLIRRGLTQDLPGFERRGGRLFAAPDAVKAMWNG